MEGGFLLLCCNAGWCCSSVDPSMVRFSRKKVQLVLTSCELGSVSKYSSVSLGISFLILHQSANLYLNICFELGLRFTSNVTASWSLMPGVLCVLVMMEGFEASL